MTRTAAIPRRSAGPRLPRGTRRWLGAAWLAAGLLLGGCRTTTPKVVMPPTRYSLQVDQLAVLSEFKLPRDHELIQDLVRLRTQIVEQLDLPPQRDQVIVYLFNSELEYTQYLDATWPGLPRRRAYFVGTPRELAVYTYWGDRIQEDLRHEYTHGILHASLKTVPLWLDEGLAEYFEVTGPRPGTVNREYAVRLAGALANGWRPDLSRLEAMDKFEQMQRTDYQEAWAWMHYLLHSSPETRDVLVGYLHDLRTEARPAPLSTRLKKALPQFEPRFLSYVGSLHSLPEVAEGAAFSPL